MPIRRDLGLLLGEWPDTVHRCTTIDQRGGELFDVSISGSFRSLVLPTGNASGRVRYALEPPWL